MLSIAILYFCCLAVADHCFVNALLAPTTLKVTAAAKFHLAPKLVVSLILCATPEDNNSNDNPLLEDLQFEISEWNNGNNDGIDEYDLAEIEKGKPSEWMVMKEVRCRVKLVQNLCLDACITSSVTNRMQLRY
jgi:hypothetical protein